MNNCRSAVEKLSPPLKKLPVILFQKIGQKKDQADDQEEVGLLTDFPTLKSLMSVIAKKRNIEITKIDRFNKGELIILKVFVSAPPEQLAMLNVDLVEAQIEHNLQPLNMIGIFIAQ